MAAVTMATVYAMHFFFTAECEVFSSTTISPNLKSLGALFWKTIFQVQCPLKNIIILFLFNIIFIRLSKVSLTKITYMQLHFYNWQSVCSKLLCTFEWNCALLFKILFRRILFPFEYLGAHLVCSLQLR